VFVEAFCVFHSSHQKSFVVEWLGSAKRWRSWDSTLSVQRERKLTPEAEEKPEVQKWRLPCSFYHSSTVVL